jgi:hypothetical protein
MTQAGSGSWFPIAYQTYFFQIAGIKQAFQYSIMITCIGFAGVNFGMYAMRHLVGRRFILIFGSLVTSMCFLGMAIAQSVSPFSIPTGKATVAFVTIWVSFTTVVLVRRRIRSGQNWSVPVFEHGRLDLPPLSNTSLPGLPAFAPLTSSIHKI